MFSRIFFVSSNIRTFATGASSSTDKFIKKIKSESERMKKFRTKLKSDISNNFLHLHEPVLIEIDPQSGEVIPESEKYPTKWGDWQHGGRVSDF